MSTSRREFLIWTGAAAAGAALWPRWALAARADARLLSWAELAPGVHACVDPMTGGNSVIAISEGGALVVDSKYPFLGAALLADARALAGAGAGDGAAITLLNTHHHGDHTGGNVAFTGQAKTLAHKNALPRIHGNYEPQFKNWVASAPTQAIRSMRGNEGVLRQAEALLARQDGLTAEDWVPQVALDDAQTLTLSGVEAEVRHFGPGHTDNDVAVRLGGADVVVAGDLIFNSLTPYFDPEGGVTARGWVKALSALEGMCDADTVVVPGHGPVGGRALVQAQREYIEKLIEAVAKDIRNGLTKERAQSKTYEFMQGLGFIQAIPRAIGAVYDELSNTG